MKKLILPMLVLLILTGCAKYEKGPLISFSSKEKRIEGKWKMTWSAGGEPSYTLYYEFGEEDPSQYYVEGGDLTLTLSDSDTSFTYSGYWNWLDNGDGIKISIAYNDSTITSEYSNVVKLTKNEMVWDRIDYPINPDFQTKFEKVE